MRLAIKITTNLGQDHRSAAFESAHRVGHTTFSHQKAQTLCFCSSALHSFFCPKSARCVASLFAPLLQFGFYSYSLFKFPPSTQQPYHFCVCCCWLYLSRRQIAVIYFPHKYIEVALFLANYFRHTNRRHVASPTRINNIISYVAIYINRRRVYLAESVT